MSLNNIPGRGNSTNRTTGTEALSDLVRYIKKIFNSSTTNSETIITSLSNIETSLVNIDTTTLRANWTTVVGNSIDYTYDVNNNVTLAEYYEGATLIFTQTFTYVGNNCTNITTS
jgi:hypothetical protein